MKLTIDETLFETTPPPCVYVSLPPVSVSRVCFLWWWLIQKYAHICESVCVCTILYENSDSCFTRFYCANWPAVYLLSCPVLFIPLLFFLMGSFTQHVRKERKKKRMRNALGSPFNNCLKETKKKRHWIKCEGGLCEGKISD